MPYQVSLYDHVLTVRLDGRCHPQDLDLELRSVLEKQAAPVIVIIDLTLAIGLDQPLKSMFSRVLQHHYVSVVGICGVNAILRKDVEDMLPVLRRVRRVVLAETEADLRSELGLALSADQPKKLSGMLAYLKKT